MKSAKAGTIYTRETLTEKESSKHPKESTFHEEDSSLGTFPVNKYMPTSTKTSVWRHDTPNSEEENPAHRLTNNHQARFTKSQAEDKENYAPKSASKARAGEKASLSSQCEQLYSNMSHSIKLSNNISKSRLKTQSTSTTSDKKTIKTMAQSKLIPSSSNPVQLNQQFNLVCNESVSSSRKQNGNPISQSIDNNTTIPEAVYYSDSLSRFQNSLLKQAKNYSIQSMGNPVTECSNPAIRCLGSLQKIFTEIKVLKSYSQLKPFVSRVEDVFLEMQRHVLVNPNTPAVVAEEHQGMP